jgi:Prokaryotic membrane lipoprotein lipid attachment site
VKRTLAALVAVLALAGCGASTTTHVSKPKTSATNSRLAQKSIKDGESFGQEAGTSGATAGQVQANCGVLRLENMPIGDMAKDWMTGCMLTGLIAANSGR